MAEENNLISVSGTVNDTIYAKGDTCLLINPFDTYHLFRIYNNWNTDSKSLLNLSDSGQKIFLIFKSNMEACVISSLFRSFPFKFSYQKRI